MWQQIINFFKEIWTKIKNPPPGGKPPEPIIPTDRPNPTREGKKKETETLPAKPPCKTGGYSPAPFSKPRTVIFPRGILFDNPSKKINSLQRKALEIFFSEYNLSVEEYGSYVAYFPSRLLAYIDQQDAFSAFRKFLSDIGITPDEVFKDRSIATFAREAIIGLFEADINCWDTPLSTEPLYQCLKSARNLDDFNNLLIRLEKFTAFAHELQRLSDKIPFYLFKQFSEKVILDLKSWTNVPKEKFSDWDDLLNEYELVFIAYSNYSEQIDRDCARLETAIPTLDQRSVIESLLKEIEKLDEQLKNGDIEIADGLDQLEILASEISDFVDEVLHRTRDDKYSKKDDFSVKNDKLSIEEALKSLNLTIEMLSMQSLKTSRKRYARVHHPDIGGDETMMKRINDAYDVLKNYLETRHT